MTEDLIWSSGICVVIRVPFNFEQDPVGNSVGRIPGVEPTMGFFVDVEDVLGKSCVVIGLS